MLDRGADESQANQLHVELLLIRRQLQERHGFDNLVGFGPAHRRLLDQVRLAAASTTPVLIVGEAGTGKRLVARTIHQNGPGRQQPLVPFDCEALPVEDLGTRTVWHGSKRRVEGYRQRLPVALQSVACRYVTARRS